MAIYRLGNRIPRIHASSYVAPRATIIGDVIVEANASIWPGAVLRGDNEPIIVSNDANVQDGAVLHTDPGFPLYIGRAATIGHQATLHGCTVGAGALIGIQAVVLNGADIGPHTLVGACALVTEGKRFAATSLVMGAPAKFIRELTSRELESLAKTAAKYVARATLYRQELRRIDDPR